MTASPRPAARAAIDPFIVMEVMREANRLERAGDAVFHLEVGQPGTPAPEGVRAAAKAALDRELIGYTDALGIPPLREAIAGHYRAHYGLGVDPGRIAVTTGSSGAFILAFLAAFAPGDRVALAAPGYPCYRHIMTALGLEPVLIEAGPNSRYQPTPELLAEQGGELQGLMVASPANPTGSMIPPEELLRLAAYCRERGIRLISDEIYHGLAYGAVEELTLADSPRSDEGGVIVVNSFSKYFSMTGWRLGWLVLPEALVTPVERLAQNLFISPPALSQHAGVAAFGCAPALEAYKATYAANRALLLERLPRLGIERFAPPDGAFYVYMDIGHLSDDSVGWCRRLLAETGIAMTPGLDFDPARGGRFVRLSFCTTTPKLAEALDRLEAWLRRG